jgi:pimeloyl-ACP methyl ester carboxylesterase
MAITGYPVPVTEHTVRTNGIDIWYVEAGEGIPLLLFHGGTASNGPLWVNHVYGWGAYLDLFAEHFRVILPDTRGHGRTRNPGGKMSYPLFAQDYLAFIEALGLEHPLICGFSDGGTIATLIGIMAPTVPRALVDWAGFQMLNPDKNAWIYRELREWLGGSPDATQSDYDGLTSNGFDLRLRIDDFEPSQGTGYVRTYFEQIFAFWTSPMEYTFADYPRITPPMLMMFGDRDHGCRLAEAYELFQQLPQGEFGIIPGMPHQLSRVGCLVALDYLQRHCDSSQD